MADISKITLPSGDTYDLKDANALRSISGTSPISVSGSAISHANSGVTAASKGDTTDQTPTWGGTFKAVSGTVNATGHLTEFAEHTVTIPDSLASDSANGLMSSEQFQKLSELPSSDDISSAQLVDAITGAIVTKTGAKSGEKAAEVSVSFIPDFSKYGTFGPTSPRTLSGITTIDINRSGKNLFDKSNCEKLQISCTATSGSTSGTVSAAAYYVAWVPLPGGVTYAVSCSTHASDAFRVTATAEHPTVTSGGAYASPILYTLSDATASTLIFNAPQGTRWIGFTLYTNSSTGVTTLEAAMEGLQVELVTNTYNLLDTASMITINSYINNSTKKLLHNTSNVKTLVIPVTPGKTYTFSRKNAGSRLILGCGTELWTDNNDHDLLNTVSAISHPTYGTITVPTGGNYLYVFYYIAANDADYDATIEEAMIVEGTVIPEYAPYPAATAFEAFSGSHTTVNFPAGAGTVYCGMLDVTAGVLTMTHALKTFDGSEEWGLITVGNYSYLRSVLSVQPYEISDNGWSSHFDYKIFNTNDFDGISAIISKPSYVSYIVAHPENTVATTAAEMKSWCAAQNTAGTPLQVVFPLLTPIEYQVDPASFTMSQGLNHFWSTANGTMTVKCVSSVGWGFASAILALIPTAQGVSF